MKPTIPPKHVTSGSNTRLAIAPSLQVERIPGSYDSSQRQASLHCVLSRIGNMEYAVAKGEGISDVAKSTALGVVAIHNERIRAFASLPHRFSPFILERPDRFPTLSILWIPGEQIHSHPMTLHELVSTLVILRSSLLSLTEGNLGITTPKTARKLMVKYVRS